MPDSQIDQILHTRKILVVDDDPGILMMAEEALAVGSTEVVTVSSGEEALSRLEDVRPDIVLLDLLMPGMDGFDTCRAIQKMPGFSSLPVIVLTGMDDVDAVDRAYKAGAWDFISKPINWQLLRHRVRYSLRSAEAFSSERRAASLSKTLDKSSNEIIVFEESTHKIVTANESALDNLGYSPEQVAELNFEQLLYDTSRSEIDNQLLDLAHKPQIDLDVNLRRKDGTGYPADGIVLYNTEEVPPTYICLFQDVTERRRTERQLHQLAYYDDLTGLPNRRLFEDSVKKAVARARRVEKACAVCIIDLDGFKEVNDAFGHAQGDLLLRMVTERLEGGLRESDAIARIVGDTLQKDPQLELARLGGDEFLVLLTDFEGDTVPAKVVDRLLKQISLPYHLDSQELNVSASVGIALYPQDGDTLDLLMQRAEHAMYTAKRSGKNNYAYYSQDSGMNSRTRITLETELRKGIDRGEFELHYQPQVDGMTGKLVGVEALVRWRHPERGMLSPIEFVSVAEESGLICPLGDWVLQEAAEQLSRWAVLYGNDFKCAVNVSGVQLRQNEFLTTTTDLLSRLDRRRGRMVLELTESSIMTTSANRVSWMRELQAMGVEIAIDDFGTGYSSLSYLKKLPIDYLKIDRSFIIDIVTNNDDRIITNTVFRMAQALGLKVVVEGVETPEQLNVVNQMGRSQIQGYFYSPPLPAEEFEQWAEAHAQASGKLAG